MSSQSGEESDRVPSAATSVAIEFRVKSPEARAPVRCLRKANARK